MRLAIFHDLPSGGAKRSLFEQVKRLSQKHHCEVYSLSTADHKFCDLRSWVYQHRIYDFSPGRLLNRPFGRYNQAQRWFDLLRLDCLSRRIAREIDGLKFDVVYAHPCRWTQAPLVIKYLQTPVVYYLQEPPRALYPEEWRIPEKGWRSYLNKIDPLLALYRSSAKRMDLIAARNSSRVLVNSHFMQAIVTKIYSINPYVCYLGVDTKVFRAFPGQPHDKFVLSVGSIQPSKGFSFIIESIAHIASAHRPMLHLVGNMVYPGERQKLQSLALDLGVQLNIEVNLSQEQLVECYNRACLFVYAPHNEPFGLTPLEAMACGRTVVGVAEGGVKETIVDGVTGRLVERNPDQMAQAIEWFLSHPDERREFERRAAQNTQQNWAWEEAVRRIEGHLQSVIR